MNRSHLLLAVLASAALYVGALVTRPITPSLPGLPAQVGGVFPLDGQYRSEPFAHATGVRLWGSWAGSDANTGALALGPFPAPATLRFAVSGYPTHEGNQLFVEDAVTKARLPVKMDFDVGERWRIVDFSLPPAWVGNPITLNALDETKTLGGWLGVSEPIRGGRGAGSAELLETLAGWSISGLLLGLLWFAALRHVTARAWVAPHWAPLVAAAAVAACAYLIFWAFFASALLGKILSVGVLALGAAGAMRPAKSNDQPGADAMAAPKLLVVIGIFYLSLLHFFPSSLEFYALAANRPGDQLPGDNTLPQNSAEFLFKGEPLKRPGEDWLSSDRPPLQAGWLLLTWTATAALRLDGRTAGGTAAVWLQLLWTFGAYGLLRTLGLGRARASAWLAVLAFTGFFGLNTIFTWPKLSAAAFACGAVGLWMFPSGPTPRRSEVVLGGALAGLAWLSHGGVAFSFLALVPWLVRRPRYAWREWALAAAVFVALALPWLAYQKFYDPPGNRLFKWHLAGVVPKDPRGTWETIRASYGALSWKEFVAHKAFNFRRQIEGDWNWWRDFSVAGAPQRLNNEFFFTARALTWWLLGFAALGVAIVRRRRRVPWPVHRALAAWTLGTLVLWCLLMFTGGQAVIHQGSYAAMLTLFVLLSAWCELAGRWTLSVLAVLQVASFATTWAVPNAVVHGRLNLLAVGIALAAVAALAALVVREHRLPDYRA